MLQVEHYLLDYALSLMPYPATWRLATQYLAWCPAHGAPAMKLLLERLPVTVPGGDSPLAHKVGGPHRSPTPLTTERRNLHLRV